MSTSDQQSELQNGDVIPDSPHSDIHQPESATIQLTDQPIQPIDNDIASQDPDPKPEVSDKDPIAVSTDQKDEGNRTFTMRELLNELKNGDDSESVTTATTVATPIYRFDFCFYVNL